MKLKSIAIFVLVGSSFFFSNIVIRDAVQSFYEETENAVFSNQQGSFDKIEIIFWLFLLHVLGVAGYMLIQYIYSLRNLSYQYITSLDLSKGNQIFPFKNS